MKLSLRLQTVSALIKNNYHTIWDCCCDHGHLGMNLITRGAAEHVHFVDNVPSIINQLHSRLETHFTGSISKFSCHCIDVQSIPLADIPPQQAQLIILAGVGGELTLDVVLQLLQQHPQHNLEFLLCPVRHQYTLRAGLMSQGLTLVAEQLLLDKGRYYEVIHLARLSHHKVMSEVVPPGSLMWRAINSEQNTIQQDYLVRSLGHYRKMQRANDDNQAVQAEISGIIAAYEEIGLQLKR